MPKGAGSARRSVVAKPPVQSSHTSSGATLAALPFCKVKRSPGRARVSPSARTSPLSTYAEVLSPTSMLLRTLDRCNAPMRRGQLGATRSIDEHPARIDLDGIGVERERRRSVDQEGGAAVAAEPGETGLLQPHLLAVHHALARIGRALVPARRRDEHSVPDGAELRPGQAPGCEAPLALVTARREQHEEEQRDQAEPPPGSADDVFAFHRTFRGTDPLCREKFHTGRTPPRKRARRSPTIRGCRRGFPRPCPSRC